MGAGRSSKDKAPVAGSLTMVQPVVAQPSPSSAPQKRRHNKGHSRAGSRAVTLIETLVAIALVAVLAGMAFLGMGLLRSARLRQSTTLIAGAVRAAYNHANATSRPTRLVFDFASRTIAIEESAGRMLLQHGERTGGAAGADEIEQEAVAAAEEILEGPRAPRASFQHVKTLGFQTEKGTARELPQSVYFRQIEVAHEEEPVTEERVYLYFWPGGQTERAAIQVMLGNDNNAEDNKVMTVQVLSPLTGKIAIDRGPIEMPRPRTDEEESERDDTGF